MMASMSLDGQVVAGAVKVELLGKLCRDSAEGDPEGAKHLLGLAFFEGFEHEGARCMRPFLKVIGKVGFYLFSLFSPSASLKPSPLKGAIKALKKEG